MSETCLQLTVEYEEGVYRPEVLGITVGTKQEINDLATIAGSTVVFGGGRGRLNIDVVEESEEPKHLLTTIQERYGWTASKQYHVKTKELDRVFGVTRVRNYKTGEIDQCELLLIRAVGKAIAKLRFGTPDQSGENRLCVVSQKPKKTVKIGWLGTSSVLGVSDDLKRYLEDCELIGVRFDEIVNGDQIWRMASSLVLPDTLTNSGGWGRGGGRSSSLAAEMG